MIHDANALDIMGKKKDGGMTLFIISSGPMDASPETQTLLLDKVENYMGYVNSEEFRREFPNVPKGKVDITLQLEEPAPKEIMMLCEKIVPWVEGSGMHFKVTVGKNG